MVGVNTTGFLAKLLNNPKSTDNANWIMDSKKAYFTILRLTYLKIFGKPHRRMLRTPIRPQHSEGIIYDNNPGG